MLSNIEAIRAKLLPILTKTAHYSAPFISTFLIVHLSAPALANLGGSPLASKTMLLGREYYQTTLTEPLLVLGPIAVHALSATLKRLLSPPGRPPRRFTHPISITGYATLFFLSIHYLTHRYYPTLEVPSIDTLGPAELDYEFVKFGLKAWPIRSWFLYGGLVFSMVLHFVDGSSFIRAVSVKDGLPFSSFLGKEQPRPRRMAIALGGVILPVLGGLYILANELPMSFSSMTSRYLCVFQSSFIYRI